MYRVAEGKLSSKFQLTVPAEIRDAMGMKAGDTVRYELDETGLRLGVVRPDIREVLARIATPEVQASMREETGGDAVAYVRRMRGYQDDD